MKGGTPPPSISDGEASCEEIRSMNPQEIRYTQTRFSRSFTPYILKGFNNNKNHGSSSQYPATTASYSEVLKAKQPELLLEALLSKLRSGETTIDTIDPIRVFQHNNSWYSLDNRRLWVFKQFGMPIPAKVTTSLDEFLRKFQQHGDNLSATFLPDPPVSKNRAKAITNGPLLHHIFRWTTDDIMNDKFLADKVKSIPRQFGSLGEYMDSFKWPLLEEVRAQLKQSLELLEEAPYAPLVQVCNYFDPRPTKDPDFETFRKFKIYVDQEHLKRSPVKHEKQDKFRPKDLVFLSSKRPGSVEELGCSGEWHMMALIQKVDDEDKGDDDEEKGASEPSGPLPLKILVHKDNARAELMDQTRTWYVVYLLNLATWWRMWDALHPADMMNSIFPIIQMTLNYDPDQNTLREDEAPSIQCLRKAIVSYCTSIPLNESQTKAIVNVVCDMKNGSDPGVRMIQGPPGTGKTSTIVTLLSVASSLGMKCLITCHTNTAIAEVALRYLEMLKSPGKIQFGEFCKSTACPFTVSATSAQKICKVLGRNDVILVGNEDKLPLQGALGEIYLPNRVKRIRKASKSWIEVAFSLFHFILSGESEYQDHQKKNAESLQENFLQFARRNLVDLVKKLEEHGKTLVEELTIDEPDMFSKTAQLATLLLDCVLEPAISEKDFPQWFENDQSRLNLAKQLKECLSSSQRTLLSTRKSIEELCMKNSSLVFCTVSTAGSFCVKQASPFDCVIIDEAAQLVEAETAIVTCSPVLNHAILVGDHQQLPATVISKLAVDSAYGRSLFERMISLGHPCHILDTQYRMHPSISLFPNLNFYKGCLINGENVRSSSYKVHEQLLYGAYAFIDVNDGVEQTDDDGKSKKNYVEAAVIVSMIKSLREASLERNIQNLTIGIITPYSSQKDLLRSCLEKQRTEPLIVDIKSVDGFQGQEKDIILLSTVRHNQSGDIGFLKDYRRLNVAITRAKYCLWIVGNRKTLSAQDNIWRTLLKDATSRELYRSATDDERLVKAIVKTKKDMDEFFDLVQMGSALFTNMLWKVLFSNDFKTSLLQIKSFEKRQKIVNKIRYLSSGQHSSRYKLNTVPAMEKTKGLIEVHIVADLCLIWTIDVERDATVKQIIKVWDVVSFSNLPKYIKRLEAAFEVYSLEYIERCQLRYLSSDKKLTLPETWEDNPEFIWLKPHGRAGQVTGMQHKSSESDAANLERSNVNESLLLMKFYALSSGIAKHLLTAEDGSEVNLPFEVNKEESIIIQHPSSCFILGRSGTGKTTVLVTKLIQREQHYQISLQGIESHEVLQGESKGKNIENREHIRQILVTLSPLLCSAIKRHVSQIQRSVSEAAGLTSACVSASSDFELVLDSDDENRMMGFLPDTLIDVPSTCYPMVLTFRKFLIMLDNSLPCPFFSEKGRWKLKEEGQEGECSGSHIDRADEKDGADVEGEKGLADESGIADVETNREMVCKGLSSQRIEVDFDQFESNYWPHLNSSLTKKLDSSMVFTEIMSIIKGSIQAVKAAKGILSKEYYLSSAANAKQPNLDMKQREDIYSLFLQYQKLKMERNSYDMADHVRHVYKQLCHGEYHGDKIDFIYIDEVQDFTQAQISLFSFVCTNAKEGFFFAGDTAQTIARGVNFRFQDVQSLFYTDFAKSAHHSEGSMIGGTDNTKLRSNQHMHNDEKFAPEFFQLRHNFRTHVGVVNMANSIVQLLYHFFPQSIDKLDLETSLICGELPALLKAQGQELVKTVFGSSGDTQIEGHDFGAQQVILVRDEDQKKQLVHQIGKKGLVLTINGCKGLEFQDVLIYNFFSGSLLRNKWRVVYEYLYQKKDSTLTKESHPAFDVNKHNLLCSELKHLYVAITRARQRLWIYEENDDLCKPMLDYWINSELVETKYLDESFISSMTASSTPHDWKKRGFELLNQKQYDMAILCFERAGDEYHAKLAKAANHQQTGEKEFFKNKKQAVASLREAAKLFLSIGRAEMAAKCCIKVGDFQKAGIIYSKNCKPPRFEDAGDCFSEAKSWLEATKAYFNGKCVKKCLDACLLGKHLETGLFFIRQWEEEPVSDDFGLEKSGQVKVLENIKNEYLRECAVIFHQQHNVTTMMMFVNAFSDISLKRTFLRRRDYIDELMSIEEAEQNYIQAAELAELKGDPFHMAELLEKAGDYDNAVKKLLFLIRKDVLWGAGNRGWPFRTTVSSTKLLQRMKELAALAKSSVYHEAQLEAQLMSVELKGPKDFKDLMEKGGHQASSCIIIKFFAIWKAVDASLNILKDVKHAKGQELDPVTKFQDTNTQLSEVINLWVEWRDIILRCRKAVNGINQDDKIKEFCYDFFAVTPGENSKTCVVHDLEAYWFKSYTKGRSPMGIPLRVFATLATQFWDEQLSNTDKRIMESITTHLSTQFRTLKTFEAISIVEETKLLLDLVEMTNMLSLGTCNLEQHGDLTRDLQMQLLALLWPKSRQAGDMCYIQKLREATRVVAILDKVADKLISGRERPRTLEETGRLQLMFPFLSESWKTKCVNNFIATIKYWKDDAMWSCNLLKSDPELCIADFVVQFGGPLIEMFNEDWRNIEGYISPFVFMALLEKATVMACACETLLHGMFLPLTLAVDFMCGKEQECLYQKILHANQQPTKENLFHFASWIVTTALQLLLKPTDVINWLKHVQADWRTHLPPMVLRLHMLLFMVCLNSRQTKLKAKIVTEIQKIFIYNNPVLQHLPHSFRIECQKILQTGAGLYEIVELLKYALSKALSSIGDTLVMTRRCKNKSCCRLLEGIKAVELESDADVFLKLAALAGVDGVSQCLEDHKTHNDDGQRGSSVQQHNMPEVTDCASKGISTPSVQAEIPTGKEEYMAYLNKDAINVKECVHGLLHRLGVAAANLKSENNNDDLLDALNDAKDTLQRELHPLDPSHEEHSVYDLDWLKARVDQVQKTHKAVEHRFERELERLVGSSSLEAEAGGDDADDADDDDKTKEEWAVVGSTANQAGCKAKRKKCKQKRQNRRRR